MTGMEPTDPIAIATQQILNLDTDAEIRKYLKALPVEVTAGVFKQFEDNDTLRAMFPEKAGFFDRLLADLRDRID